MSLLSVRTSFLLLPKQKSNGIQCLYIVCLESFMLAMVCQLGEGQVALHLINKIYTVLIGSWVPLNIISLQWARRRTSNSSECTSQCRDRTFPSLKSIPADSTSLEHEGLYDTFCFSRNNCKLYTFLGGRGIPSGTWFYHWLCAQKFLQADSEGCWGLNLGQTRKRQMPYPLY